MGMATTIRRWQSNWARAHEFDALAPDQRRALARDVGVPEDALGRLAARGNGGGAELTRLMAALSLDEDQIKRTQVMTMRDMRITCSGCVAVSRCRRELARGQASSTYHEYCPNTETLQVLGSGKTC